MNSLRVYYVGLSMVNLANLMVALTTFIIMERRN